MQYIPTPITGKTSNGKKHYSYGKCPHCNTFAEHEREDDYIVCAFCNKRLKEEDFISARKPSSPKISNFPEKYTKKRR